MAWYTLPIPEASAEIGLTKRETEALRELVLTEDKQTVISGRFSIKVKTLQDYVTRLYRKTGAATRSRLKYSNSL